VKLEHIVIPTGIAEPGMLVRDVFRLCVETGIPAVPFRSRSGQRPDGWVSLHHILKHGCIPEYMIELADVLGNQLGCLDDAESRVREIVTKPADEFVRTPLRSVSTAAPVLKAIAILENHRTSYLFVLDGDEYRGIVTALGIARRMLAVEHESPDALVCNPT
jgi:CBS domain-containing protein